MEELDGEVPPLGSHRGGDAGESGSGDTFLRQSDCGELHGLYTHVVVHGVSPRYIQAFELDSLLFMLCGRL
jgi:hypothetical protein